MMPVTPRPLYNAERETERLTINSPIQLLLFPLALPPLEQQPRPVDRPVPQVPVAGEAQRGRHRPRHRRLQVHDARVGLLGPLLLLLSPAALRLLAPATGCAEGPSRVHCSGGCDGGGGAAAGGGRRSNKRCGYGLGCGRQGEPSEEGPEAG